MLIGHYCIQPARSFAEPDAPRCDRLFTELLAAQNQAMEGRDKGRDHVTDNDFDMPRWKKDHDDQWKRVLNAARRYLGYDCANGRISLETDILKIVAEGLKHQGEAENAVPVLQRCLSLDSEKSSCWYELGEVEMNLCRFDDARVQFQKVVKIGAFTELNALLVDSARSMLQVLENPIALENIRSRWSCPVHPNSGDKAASDKKRFGSGFFVSKQGHIVTNSHVVEGCRTIATRDGKALTLIDRNPRTDLALLKAEAIPEGVAVFRSGTPPRPGDVVIAFGFPLPDIIATQGNVSTGVLSATAGLHDDIRFVQISAAVQPGSSGGPLLDASGHVIGVVVGKLDPMLIARLMGDIPQNVNFAVHWAELRAFLDQEGVEYGRATSNPSQGHDIAQEARRFSVAIECTE